jgi:hypothetical protein
MPSAQAARTINRFDEAGRDFTLIMLVSFKAETGSATSIIVILHHALKHHSDQLYRSIAMPSAAGRILPRYLGVNYGRLAGSGLRFLVFNRAGRQGVP